MGRSIRQRDSAKEAPGWQAFERAVADFIRALMPHADTQPNIRMPDAHHGGPRQRDVYIETKLGGHFPVRILVSCKDYGRKLDSLDVDHFNGEMQSDGAALGVLYSSTGFNSRAVKKASKLGISCCRLYRDEPPEIPSQLSFTSYCCCPQIGLSVSRLPNRPWPFVTWKDLFAVPLITDCGEKRYILDELELRYKQAERAAIDQARSAMAAPKPFDVEVSFGIPPDNTVAFSAKASVRWKYFQARMEACRLNGSYEFTSSNFKGKITHPRIHMRGPHPGPGWEELSHYPHGDKWATIAILFAADPKSQIFGSFGQLGLNPMLIQS